MKKLRKKAQTLKHLRSKDIPSVKSKLKWKFYFEADVKTRVNELKKELEKYNKDISVGTEILRAAECLDNVDDDISDAVLKSMKRDNISYATLVEEMQKIKEDIKEKLKEEKQKILKICYDLIKETKQGKKIMLVFKDGKK